jgi:hypothetical protein
MVAPTWHLPSVGPVTDVEAAVQLSALSAAIAATTRLGVVVRIVPIEAHARSSPPMTGYRLVGRIHRPANGVGKEGSASLLEYASLPKLAHDDMRDLVHPYRLHANSVSGSMDLSMVSGYPSPHVPR